MTVELQLSSGNSEQNSEKNHNLTTPIESGMHRFKRQCSCIFRDGRNETEIPLKTLPLTFYKQTGTNSIIVLMSLDSQRVHIQSICMVCNKKLKWFSIK